MLKKILLLSLACCLTACATGSYLNRPKQDPKDYIVRRVPKDNGRIAEGVAPKNPVLQDITGVGQQVARQSNPVTQTNDMSHSNNGFSKQMLNISKSQSSAEQQI